MGAILYMPRMAWLCGPLGHIRNLFSYLELFTSFLIRLQNLERRRLLWQSETEASEERASEQV